MLTIVVTASSAVAMLGMLATNFIIMRRVQHIDTSMKGAVSRWLRKVADSMDTDDEGREK